MYRQARRADLVPNLVATVKASAQHEEKTLTEVTFDFALGPAVYRVHRVPEQERPKRRDRFLARPAIRGALGPQPRRRSQEPGSMRRLVFSFSLFSAIKAARRARLPALSAYAMSSPRRRRTCW